MEESEYIKLIDSLLEKKPEQTTLEEKNWLMIDRVRCEKDFYYWFKRYAKLQQAPTLTSPGGILPFQLWPHVSEILAALFSNLLISILKSRQIGASWLIAAYCLWNAEFHAGDKTLLFSKGEMEASELLNKCWIIYNHQAWHLKQADSSIVGKSSTKIEFKNGSAIEALAATENAGIGYQVSRIVADEHIEHPYAAKNYMAAKPTIDSGGGQYISIFTSNEDKLDSLAVSLFLGGMDGKNGFKSLFFPYTVRPGRSDDWYEKVKNSIPQEELKGITPDVYMARNYPRSIEEALSPSKTIAVFDKQVLDAMIGNVENPLEMPDIDNKIIHIYRPFLIGDAYIAISDTSHGVGKDYNVTIVLEVKTGRIVADIYNNRISPEELAYHSVKLLALYKNPLWGIEDNDWGRTTINKAVELGYKNFLRYGAKNEKIGFHTGVSPTKLEIWGSGIPAVNNRQITIFNKDAIKSLYDVVRKAEKNGEIEAINGKHDDYAWALVSAIYYKDKVRATFEPLKPIKSLTFAR